MAECQRILPRIYWNKILQAINYFNQYGIVHRDIKPENILVSKSGEIRIIDFGLARIFKSTKFNDVVGTPYYVAPEVLMTNHGPSCDVWSVGVLMYIMLSGYLPFTGQSPNQVFAKIIKGKLSFDQPEWNNYSEESQDLIRSMLKVDIDERISAEDALKHPWFNSDETSTN